MAQESDNQPLVVDGLCKNCGQSLQGDYCSNCGQRNKEFVRFFPSLIIEAFEGLLAFNSRTYLTLWYLLSRPAFLSNEYLSGRRVRYLPPMRLFLVFILIFIFTISVELFLDSIGVNQDPDANITPVEELESDQISTTVTISTLSGTREFVIDGEDSESINYVLELIGNLRLPFLSAETNQEFVRLLQTQAETNIPAIRENPRDFASQLLEYVPILMLILMPFLALIQQVAYLGSGRYYIEHLVLTIHNHSFLFLAFILSFLLDLLTSIDITVITRFIDLLNTLVSIWIIVYLYLSLKFFFQQGYIVTFLKYLVISITYGTCLIVGIIAVMLFGFFAY